MKTKYMITLEPKEITPDIPYWSSKQLEVILSILKSHKGELNWYIADVFYIHTKDISEIVKEFPNSRARVPYLIGNTSKLIGFVKRTDYFESGVFLGIQNQKSSLIEGSEGFWTEDEEWRDILDALIEIRTFDTSYYEIYSSDKDLLHQILTTFSLHKKITLNTDYSDMDPK